MPIVLPNAPPLKEKKHRIPPEIVGNDGRKYLSSAKYNERLGEAAFQPYELVALRKAGMPHIAILYGSRFYFYYNWEDCCRWHRGEDVG